MRGRDVMVLGCVACNGDGNIRFLEGKTTAMAYVNILQHNFKDIAKKLGLEKTFVCQQDQDPKCTANKTKEWPSYNVSRRQWRNYNGPNSATR